MKTLTFDFTDLKLHLPDALVGKVEAVIEEALNHGKKQALQRASRLAQLRRQGYTIVEESHLMYNQLRERSKHSDFFYSRFVDGDVYLPRCVQYFNDVGDMLMQREMK